MRKKRFTLIELLVVIAIIAILSGMLLPALGNAKAFGKNAQCLNQEKQFSLILMNYADANNGWGPVVKASGGYTRWPAQVVEGGYLKQLELFICPEAELYKHATYVFHARGKSRTQLLTDSGKTYFNYVHYTMPKFIVGTNSDDSTVRNLTKAFSPAQKVFLADSCGDPVNPINYGSMSIGERKGLSSPFFVTGSENLQYLSPFIAPRHMGAGNMLWLDGHVTTEKDKPWNRYQISTWPLKQFHWDPQVSDPNK